MRFTTTLALTLTTTLGSMLGTAAPAAAASDCQVHDESSEKTAWRYYRNVTLQTLINSVDDGYRVVDIEIQNDAGNRFSAALVANTGDYQTGWWWYVGKTAQEVSDLLAEKEARLIDLEVYRVNGQKRYAVVMVPRAGECFTGWWYYTDATWTQVLDRLDDNNARPIDIDTYILNGQRRFSVVMVGNSGAQARPWKLLSNVTEETLNNASFGDGYRIIDVEDRGDGKFTAIMIQNEGHHWSWWYGQTGAQLAEKFAQYGHRISDIEPYDTPAGTRYMAAMIDNADPLARSVRNSIMNNTDGAKFGFRLDEVGNGLVTGMNTGAAMYPASSVKVLPHLHAMRRVEQNPFITLNTPIDVYSGSDSCDDNHAGQTPMLDNEPLGDVLELMMENSSNPATNAIIDYFGMVNIQNTTDLFNDTNDPLELNHKLGCGGPSNDPPNAMSCKAINRVYEQVALGNAFNFNSTRDTFYDLMVNSNWMLDVIEDERPNDMNDDVYDAFIDGVENARKAGSYSQSGQLWRTNAGMFALPVGCNGEKREFVFSVLIDSADDIEDGFGTGNVMRAMSRDSIREAMEDFNGCFECEWDLDGNGLVGQGDLIVILANWGPCSSCDFDANGDGIIGTLELVRLLANWGDCPTP